MRAAGVRAVRQFRVEGAAPTEAIAAAVQGFLDANWQVRFVLFCFSTGPARRAASVARVARSHFACSFCRTAPTCGV